MEYIRLANGRDMPLLGFGTWQANDEELEVALDAALQAGYRHIDTAAAYENEHVIGKVLKKWINDGKLSRDDLFIVTKLPAAGNHPESVEKYINLSLKYLQMEYIDLYLIHTPFGFVDGEGLHPFDSHGNIKFDPTTDLVAIWKEMEVQLQKGKAKAIGVSNFNITQLKRVIDSASHPPDNLQIELHAYFQQQPLVQFCHSHGISVCAYSPLASRGSAQLFSKLGIKKELPDLLSHPTIKKMAKRYNKTAAQILLKHTIQKGIAVIPKSTNAKRIKENIEIFDFKISEEEIRELNQIDQGESSRVVDFSFFKGLADGHPEFPFKQ